MELHPGKRAVTYLTLILSPLSVLVAGLSVLPALWLNRLFWLGCPVLLGLFGGGIRWYVPRYLRSCTARYSDHHLFVSHGVWWKREWHLPLTALRTFVWWETPLSRCFRCQTLCLHYAGGRTWIPFLDRSAAQWLNTQLTEALS